MFPNIPEAERSKQDEMRLWIDDSKQRGITVKNLDDIKGIIPLEDKENIIRTIENEGWKYSVYCIISERKRIKKKVAYDCPHCNMIIIGPPRIEADNSIGHDDPICGRSGLDFYCFKCEKKIYESTFEMR